MRRAIVIGGSLGGLFAGNTLLRSGWDVAIVERSGGRLEDRGAGLGVHPPMLQGLLAAGAEVDGSVGVAVGSRTAFAPRRQHCRRTSHATVLHLVGSALLDAVGRFPGGTHPLRRRPNRLRRGSKRRDRPFGRRFGGPGRRAHWR